MLDCIRYYQIIPYKQHNFVFCIHLNAGLNTDVILLTLFFCTLTLPCPTVLQTEELLCHWHLWD